MLFWEFVRRVPQVSSAAAEDLGFHKLRGSKLTTDD
jgi:hypothetical protein